MLSHRKTFLGKQFLQGEEFWRRRQCSIWGAIADTDQKTRKIAKLFIRQAREYLREMVCNLGKGCRIPSTHTD